MMQDRNRQLVRTWNILVLLRQRRRSLLELAKEFSVHPRTIRRDLEALCEAGFPIVTTRDDRDKPTQESFWYLAPLEGWPMRDPVPSRRLETFLSHSGYAAKVRS